MQSALYAGAIALALPLMASALEVHIEGVPASGTYSYTSGIISNVNASVSATGGLVAPGATVSEGTSASADVRTVVNGGGGVRIEVRTEEGGRVHTETMEKRLSETNVDIHIATTSATPDIRASVRVLSGTTTKEVPNTVERSWWWFWGTSSVRASTTPFVQLRSGYLERFFERAFGFFQFW